MPQRYIKTDSGRAEIRGRVHAITRTARNLLLIIDGSRTSVEWLSMVNGATETDLRTLFEAGLISLVAETTELVEVSLPADGADVTAGGVQTTLSYAELYTLLPSLAKEHLGLMKGYRFALSIEKADGMQGLQQVAMELIAEVERAKGAAVARSVRRALLMS